MTKSEDTVWGRIVPRGPLPGDSLVPGDRGFRGTMLCKNIFDRGRSLVGLVKEMTSSQSILLVLR